MNDHLEIDPIHSHKSASDRNEGVIARIKRRWCAFTQASVREIFAEMIARFMIGLFFGGVACFLLIPIIFWPSKRNPKPIFDQMSDLDWAKWLFAGVLFLPAIIGAFSTMLDDPKAGFLGAIGFRKRCIRSVVEDGVEVIEEERDSSQSYLGRIIKTLLHIVMWGVVIGVPLIFILAGIQNIQTEQIHNGRYRRTIYGPSAVGFGWIKVAIGACFLGYGLEFLTRRTWFKYFGWGITALIVVWVIRFLFVQ